MKLNRKATVLGIAALGLAAATAVGVGVAQAESSPTPATSSSATPPYGPGGGMGLMHGMADGQRRADVQHPCLSAAASYLGLSETELQTQLRDGKSLADVAKAQGKPLSGLKDAMIAARKASLDANTTLTPEQKAAILEHMKSQIDTMVTSTHGPGMRDGHMRDGHMGGGRMGGWMHGNR